MEDIRWQQRLENYSKALGRLNEAVMINMKGLVYDSTVNTMLQEDMIHRFEFTQELAWKVMQDYEKYLGVGDGGGPRNTIRIALNIGLIDDPTWLSMVNDRNLTTHEYNQDTASEIAEKIISAYLPLLDKFEERMNEIKAKEA